MSQRIRKHMPKSKFGRIVVGLLLIIGGFLGFLPILGFWMIPLGLIVLSVDFSSIRGFRRRQQIRWGRYKRERAAKKSGSKKP